jgi:hypothetical protein
MSQNIEVKHKGLSVKIYVSQTSKKGTAYTTYQVADYSSGQRKFWSFSDEARARAKAEEIAEGKATGKDDVFVYAALKRPIQRALEEARGTGMRLDEAVGLLRKALEIVPADEMLEACRFWKNKRPNKPFDPKTAKQAVDDHLPRHRASVRRKRALKTYYGHFSKKFGTRKLHEIDATEICDWANSAERNTGKGWSAKTQNEVLNALSGLYKEAIFRNWVPAGYNPCSTESIKRPEVKPGNIGIFTPIQVAAIMQKIKDDLKPFMCLWFFGATRKEEVARLRWGQIRAAVKTGILEIEPEQGLKTGGRSINVLPNLMAWLKWSVAQFPDAEDDEPVLPLNRGGGRKLDDISKRVACQSKVPWVDNGPRHSYITYRCKVTQSTVDVADEAGNSPHKIEKHYRRKAISIDDAKAYFEIMPPDAPANVMRLAA